MHAPLAAHSTAARRLILACFAQHDRTVHRAVYDRLRDETWAPTPEDCPVDWQRLERWYQGLKRTGQLVMDSY